MSRIAPSIQEWENVEKIRYLDTSPQDMALPTVVLMHGLGLCMESWEKVVDYLTQRGFRVLVFDLPGYGLSRSSLRPGDLDGLARVCASFIRSRTVEGEFVLVGHSLGGIVCSRICSLELSRPKSVVLVSAPLWRAIGVLQSVAIARANMRVTVAAVAQLVGGILPPPSGIAAALLVTKVGRRLFLWPFVGRVTTVDPDQMARVLRFCGPTRLLKVIKLHKAARMLEIEHLVHPTPIPTIVVTGECDALIPVEDVMVLRGARPDGFEIEIVRECGHWPPLESPSAVGAAIVRAMDIEALPRGETRGWDRPVRPKDPVARDLNGKQAEL